MHDRASPYAANLGSHVARLRRRRIRRDMAGDRGVQPRRRSPSSRRRFDGDDVGAAVAGAFHHDLRDLAALAESNWPSRRRRSSTSRVPGWPACSRRAIRPSAFVPLTVSSRSRASLRSNCPRSRQDAGGNRCDRQGRQHQDRRPLGSNDLHDPPFDGSSVMAIDGDRRLVRAVVDAVDTSWSGAARPPAGTTPRARPPVCPPRRGRPRLALACGTTPT